VAKRRRKLTKKEIKEDEVAEFFVDVGHFVGDHWKKIVGGLVVAVIAVAILGTWKHERGKAEAEAETWLWRANLDMRSGNVGNAIQAYTNIIERYRGTWSHSDATFFMANAQFSTGRYDSALVTFETYLDLGRRRDQFTVSSRMGIAQCLEELTRYDDAAQRYLMVQQEHPESPLAPDALLGAARCYELAGDLQMAESTYGKLLDLYPDASQASIARIRRLEMQAKLETT
jgi:TolA-binding protein